MLIIDLFPSTVTTRREDPKGFEVPPQHGFTWDWKKRGKERKDDGVETHHIFDLDLKKDFLPY